MSEIDQGIIEIIGNHAVGATGPITRDTAINDLGIDSFAIVEIIYDVEEKLNVEIPFNANENPLEGASTVGELIDIVKRLSGRQ